MRCVPIFHLILKVNNVIQMFSQFCIAIHKMSISIILSKAIAQFIVSFSLQMHHLRDALDKEPVSWVRRIVFIVGVELTVSKKSRGLGLFLLPYPKTDP